MITRILKKLLRSINKSIILSIVIVFSLIIIGLVVQIIFLFRDIHNSNTSSSLSNNKSIHNHHNHYHNNNNHNDNEVIIDSENVRGKSKTLLRHRIDEKRKSLKLNNDSNTDTNTDVHHSDSNIIKSINKKPNKNNHNSLIKAHALPKPKHRHDKDHYNTHESNVISWYINSIIRIIMSFFKLLYSIITVFSLKKPVSRSSYTYENQLIYHNEDTSNNDVPYIVQLWREAKLDWHTLIPKHDSSFERYYHDKNDSHSLFQLKVLKEKSITDYLTRYHESGLSALYGHNHGRLKTYASCDILSSGCNIHDQNGCNNNQLCYWDNDNEICNDIDEVHASSNSAGNKCQYPKQFSGNGTIISVDDHSQCSTYTNQKTVVLTLESETQLMFYHFWAMWTDIMYTWHSKYLDNRNIHFYIKDIVDPMFFTYFGFITDFCWRRLKNQVPQGVCFCDVTELKPHQSRIEFTNAADYIIEYLNLQDVSPPKHKAKVGIVSRRRKRFILNEYKLVKICTDMGIECELLPLESMTIYEQVRAFRTLDVLIGIHGSALDNVGFLPEGSVLVQLLPYKVKYRATFKATALKAGVKYMEWKATNPKLSVFHWDNLQESNPRKLEEYTREEILEEGQDTAGQRETLMFWINQDIIVPEDEWKQLLINAVMASPSNQTRHLSINE